ncbi:YueI family protein [Lederbergia lenta]|uniref:Cytoplasmic protein n=1 Tax=Lederbergia lenta TaxID=1467 RepID=A0A2X4W8V9_LEDLE|nr:YueI family protein [Lederbergia lenta]MCM3111506.1 YueI family protein [Lederbergia lenta]MEC2325107.1 YueI family protein [Lederbergia lenta]SQI56398.1 cytoplasmic protein [Lederbergia lenta]
MKNSNVDEYLQNGIYGTKQIKPEERKKFLGTLRERIVSVLTKSQVMEHGVYPEVETLMDEHPEATMLLNGDLDYSFLSDYIHLARKKNIPFSIVANQNTKTDIGLVLAYDYAINKEEIYITKNKNKNIVMKKPKKSLASRIFNYLKK